VIQVVLAEEMEFKRDSKLHRKVGLSIFADSGSEKQRRAAILHVVDLAERAERFEDMASLMRLLLENGTGFTNTEERDKFVIAYKNVLTSLRQSWNEASTSHDAPSKAYADIIKAELEAWCGDLVHLIENHLLLVKKHSVQDQALLYKTVGDCCRYLAECNPSQKKFARMSEEHYMQAEQIAAKGLPVTDPVRLGIALNYSVFQYEILHDVPRAIDTADSAFDASMSSVDGLDRRSFPDSALVMQFLRDNLTEWERQSKR
jgi:14-3-3 protein epsilon